MTEKTEIFNFENAEQLKEKLDKEGVERIINIIPLRYRTAEMGSAEKLTSVLIIYL
jgi:hypothetical protein